MATKEGRTARRRLRIGTSVTTVIRFARMPTRYDGTVGKPMARTAVMSALSVTRPLSERHTWRYEPAEKNNGIQWSKALNLSHWMLIHWYPSSYCLLFISRVEALLMKTWASCTNEYSVWSKINKSGLPVPTLFLVVSASSDRPLHTLALNNKTLTLRGALQPTQGDEHVRLSFLTQEKHTLFMQRRHLSM